MGRKPCCAKQGLNKGAWSAAEDQILINYIQVHGDGKWRDLPQKAGLKRCGKSCRLRWLNYLRPNIKRGDISVEEEELIIKLHNLLGNRWSLIAGRLPGRTDNEIKNYWNTNLSKRVKGDDDKSMQLRKSKKTRCSGNSSMNSKSEEISKTADEPHQVIRTKAVRCTKVVIPELLNYNQTMDTNVGENSQSSSALQEDNNSASHDLLMNFDISELLVWDDAYLSSSSGSLQANNHEINNNEDGDHHHDRNMADGNLDVDHHDQMIKNMTSCFPECYDSVPDQAMFEDLILDGRTRPENWTDIDSDHFQNNIDTMDLKSLAVFLDSED